MDIFTMYLNKKMEELGVPPRPNRYTFSVMVKEPYYDSPVQDCITTVCCKVNFMAKYRTMKMRSSAAWQCISDKVDDKIKLIAIDSIATKIKRELIRRRGLLKGEYN